MPLICSDLASIYCKIAFLHIISKNVGQDVGQYQNEFKPIPYLQHKKKWTGWDLNPRPQPAFFKDSAFYLSKVVVALERELYCSNPTSSILFLSTCLIGSPSSEICSDKIKKYESGFGLGCRLARAQGLASNIKLNGVCVARRNFEKPADVTISLILSSPACAPSAGPFSFKDAGTQTTVDAA